MRLEYQDDIDNYLMNRLSDDEKCSFEVKCAVNPELKDQLEYTQNVKTIISERNEMLAKIQKWDDEYNLILKNEDRNKRIRTYWLSAIAAVFIVGFFLFTTKNIDNPADSGEKMSMNYRNDTAKVESVYVGSKIKKEKQKDLLAKNDVNKENKKEKNVQINIDHEQTFSFSRDNMTTTNTSQTDSYEKELKKIEEKKNELTKSLTDLKQEKDSGKIDETFYESSAALLNLQINLLRWKESIILINMDRKEEALSIIDDLRRGNSPINHKADSLYNELKKSN